MSFTTNPWESSEGSSKYALTVNDQQTIQQVIDGIPVMAGSLASGITNPYIVNVPPGHEKEYYSLVRDASDAASDKRNVKVVFEDNLNGDFRVELFSKCDELGSWNQKGKWFQTTTGATITADDIPNSDQKRIKAVSNGSGDTFTLRLMLTDGTTPTDIRKYQGFLMRIKWTANLPTSGKVFFVDGNDNSAGTSIVLMRTDHQITATDVDRMVFVPMAALDATDTSFDPTTITQFRVEVDCNAVVGDVYVTEILAVRTTQTKKLVIRFDDSLDEHYTHAVNELEKKGWKGNFMAIPNLVNAGGATSITTVQAKEMGEKGHLICNHGINATSYDSKDYNASYYGHHAANNWLLMAGLNGFGITLFPGYQENTDILDIVENSGGVYVSNSSFPLKNFTAGTPPVSTLIEILEGFNYGGIFSIDIHSFADAATLGTLLGYIETQFSEVLVYTDIISKMDAFPVSRLKQSFSYVDCGLKETLTVNRNVFAYEGNTFFFDPGGAARNVTPDDTNIKFVPGHRIEIINTADAAETITFDPTGANQAIAQNERAIFHFDGSSWKVVFVG